MRKIVAAPLIIFILWLTPDAALGCGCNRVEGTLSPARARALLIEDYNKAFAIFSGEVVALDTFKAKIKVDKVWKGELGDEVTMSTGAEDLGGGRYVTTSCDYSFKAGEKYLIFAYGDRPEEMRTHVCTRTGRLAHSEQQVQELDEVWPHTKRNQAREPR
jgi:hypothetical protein